MIKVKSTVQKTLKEQMKTDAWPLFWQECVGYAEKRFDQEIWFGVKGAKGGVPPDCKMGVDIVNLVIKKFLLAGVIVSRMLILKHFSSVRLNPKFHCWQKARGI